MRTLLISLFGLLLFSTAQAAVGDTIAYQARLLNPDLTPKSGNYDVRVSFWGNADALNGNETDITGNLWTETQTLALDADGKFYLQIGDSIALPSPLDTATYQYFQIDVKTAGGPTYTMLDPYPADNTKDRKTLTSVAFAQNSAALDGRTVGLAANQIPYLDGSGELPSSIISGLDTTLSGIGSRTYTAQNYVSNGETVTASLDALDLQLKATTDSLANVSTDVIADADDNTKVQVEESANENKIRFDTNGLERMIIDENGASLSNGVVTTNLKSLSTHGEVGTTTASDFRMKVNGLPRINMLAGGDTAYGVNATSATANHDFYGSVRVRGQLIDAAGNGGGSEQILVSTGSGTEWRSAPSSKIITQASHGFSISNNIPLPAYVNNSGTVLLAQADDQNTLTAFFITEIIDANSFRIKMNGLHTASSHGLTIGQYYFLSDSTPAATTLTSPTISDVVFYILDANTLYLKDNRPFNTP